MTIVEALQLADVVRRMRAAQKLYFRNRSTADLARARELEAEVDALLRGPAGPGEQQGDLFGPAKGGPYGERR